MRDARPEQDAGHGAGEHGRGEEDVDPPRLQVAEGGEGGQDERVDEIGADHRLRGEREEEREHAQEERAAALKTRLDKAVTDGKLTQAEADAVTKAVEAGVIGGGGR